MTAEAHHHHEDLHDLVDRLNPGQAEAVRAVVLQLVASPAPATRDGGEPSGDWPPAWFGSVTSDDPRVAERSREIMRAEYGRP